MIAFCEKTDNFILFFAQNIVFCALLCCLAIAIFSKFAIIKIKEHPKCIVFLPICRKSVCKTVKGRDKVYTAMNIAAEVVRQYQKHKQPITNLKLQKVLYYVQMNALQKDGCALFEEDFQAWRHGPVLPGIYEAFRKYISGNIDYKDPVLTQNEVAVDPECENRINEIVVRTLNLSAWDMVYKTHETKPWKDTYIPDANRLISKDRIRMDGEVNLS